MSHRDELKDPSNVSSLLFQPNKSTSNTSTQSSCQYVGPIEIANNEMVVSGRGLLATRDISPGDCLFVTPATVSAHVESVHQQWITLDDGHSSGRLEEITERVLVEQIKEMLSNGDEHGTVESCLALAGASLSNTDCLSIEQLTGQSSLKQATGFSMSDISDIDLLKIIRKNAFGPDFITYSSIEKRWRNSATFTPSRLLGLFPLAAMINHSCAPNAVRVFSGDTMIAHACDSIKAGQEIVWSYLPPTQPYPQRQEILCNQHGFECSCRRCSCEANFWNTQHPQLSASSLDSWVRLCNQSLDDMDVHEARSAAIRDLEELLQAKDITNETKYFIRVGFAQIYLSYVNDVLQSKNISGTEQFESLLQKICMPLHLSLVACNNASTEHLSILHVCYEMIGIIHAASKDKESTINKLRFWTTQVQKACMVRYGSLGHDIESVRKVMQHTRIVLRKKNGFDRSSFCFV